MAANRGDGIVAPDGDERAVRIGVTGHRPVALRGADVGLIRARVREVFAAARAAEVAGAGHLEVISPLAEGADRLVAGEAIAAGLPLVCPLPFDRDSYAADFKTVGSRAEYHALLAAAARVVELAGSRASPEAAYAAVGVWMLEHSDVLLAIWDGAAPRGEGGTGHVVRDALARHIPVVWVQARPPHEVRILTSAEDGVPVDEPLARLSQLLAVRDETR